MNQLLTDRGQYVRALILQVLANGRVTYPEFCSLMGEKGIDPTEASARLSDMRGEGTAEDYWPRKSPPAKFGLTEKGRQALRLLAA